MTWQTCRRKIWQAVEKLLRDVKARMKSDVVSEKNTLTAFWKRYANIITVPSKPRRSSKNDTDG
jgi:predicted acetyltransferase